MHGIDSAHYSLGGRGMNKKLIRFKVLCWLFVGVQLLLALFTLHDVATAQGVGLYLALQKGSPDRLPFDICVDVCGMICLILVLLIPYLLLQHRGADALLRLEISYFALVPALSMAMLVHLFDGHNLLRVSFVWEDTSHLLFGYVREAVPLLLLLGALYIKSGFSLKKWHKRVFLVLGVLILGMCFLPELASLLQNVAYYLLVVIAYDWWESLYATEKNGASRAILWLIFVLLLGRGCFKMLDLTSHYSL